MKIYYYFTSYETGLDPAGTGWKLQKQWLNEEGIELDFTEFMSEGYMGVITDVEEIIERIENHLKKEQDENLKLELEDWRQILDNLKEKKIHKTRKTRDRYRKNAEADFCENHRKSNELYDEEDNLFIENTDEMNDIIKTQPKEKKAKQRKSPDDIKGKRLEQWRSLTPFQKRQFIEFGTVYNIK